MGNRSTFVTNDYPIHWPDWFYEKYKKNVFFNDDHIGVIASKYEGKMYGIFSELIEDIATVVDSDPKQIVPIRVISIEEENTITYYKIIPKHANSCYGTERITTEIVYYDY